MTEEINATQRSIYTQFSLPLISRNENEENGSNNPTPVGDKDKLTPPIESSHHAERADNSSGEAAHTANGSPLKHPTSKFCFKFRENGALEEIICENINDIPQWIINSLRQLP